MFYVQFFLEHLNINQDVFWIKKLITVFDVEEIMNKHHEISNWPLFFLTPSWHIPKERHFCLVGFFFNMHLGTGTMCMHVTHVPQACTFYLIEDRKHISYISCLASCCRGTNCSAWKVHSLLSSVFEVSFERTSRSAQLFLAFFEGCAEQPN